MIKPTIGRVVWFYPGGYPPETQPFTALICHVHSDTMVNLAVFDENGIASNSTSRFLWNGEGDRPTGDYAEWMPYQQGQAAKTEAAE